MAQKLSFYYDFQKAVRNSIPDELRGNVIDKPTMSFIDRDVSEYIDSHIDREEVLVLLKANLSADKDYSALGATYTFSDANGTEKNIENLSISQILKLRMPEQRYDDDGNPLENREQVIIDTLTSLLDKINTKEERDRTINEKLLLESEKFYSAMASIRTMQTRIQMQYNASIQRSKEESISQEEAKSIAQEEVAPFIPTSIIFYEELKSSVEKLSVLTGKNIGGLQHSPEATPENTRNTERRSNSNNLSRVLQVIINILTLLFHALSRMPVAPVPGAHSLGVNTNIR